MDEDNTTNQAENNQAAEDSSQEASPATKTTTSEQTEQRLETDSQSSSAEESGVETDSQREESSERKPTRAERRIRQLSDELRQYRQLNNQQQFQHRPALNVNPGEELTLDQYQQHIAQQADTIASLRVEERMQQYEAQANLERDTEVLPSKYPELDENHPDYNPVLVERIGEQFKARAFRNNQLDTSVRLADIAKDYVDVARAAAKKSSAEVRRAVDKTADESAIKPTSDKRPDKSPSDMSIKEMEQKYGIVG